MHLRTSMYIQLWDPASVLVGKNLYLSTNGQRYAARAKVQACVACSHSSRELPFLTCRVLICVAMYMTGCITPYYTFTAHAIACILCTYCIAIVSSNSAPLQWFSVCVYTTPPPFSHSLSLLLSFLSPTLPAN